MIEVEEPYIDLRDGVKRCMRFSSVRAEHRDIPADTGQGTKRRQVFLFKVSNLDGTPVDKELSIMSKKLKDRLKPYIDSGEYLTRTFCIQRHGESFAARYSLDVR